MKKVIIFLVCCIVMVMSRQFLNANKDYQLTTLRYFKNSNEIIFSKVNDIAY